MIQLVNALLLVRPVGVGARASEQVAAQLVKHSRAYADANLDFIDGLRAVLLRHHVRSKRAGDCIEGGQ